MITGWLPYEKVSDAMRDCHAGLILFRECIENRMAGPPNKLFNYMNAGLPVLSVDFPEMRQIIMEEECGVLLNDQSVKSILLSSFYSDPKLFVLLDLGVGHRFCFSLCAFKVTDIALHIVITEFFVINVFPKVGGAFSVHGMLSQIGIVGPIE